MTHFTSEMNPRTCDEANFAQRAVLVQPVPAATRLTATDWYYYVFTKSRTW
jgi:hypothetical protein